jgi:hypothetical protein
VALIVTHYDRFTNQLEASHLGLDKAAPAIGASLLPDFPAKPARGRHDGVAGFGIRAMFFLRLGVLARRDNRLRPTLRNRFVTTFGVVFTIAADARNDLIGRNLVEQTRQRGRIAGSVVGYFDSPDFQCGRVNARVDFAPLAAVISPMLLSLLLAFTQHFVAGAVDQEVQSRCCRLRADRHRKMLLAQANGAEVGHLSVQASELEQALRNAYGLAQGQIEQALDRQAELDCRLAGLRTAAPLAARTAVPTHGFV